MKHEFLMFSAVSSSLVLSSLPGSALADWTRVSNSISLAGPHRLQDIGSQGIGTSPARLGTSAVDQNPVSGSYAPQSSALIQKSGDLEAYLKAITYGMEDDQLWRFPSSTTRAELAAALRHLFTAGYEQAAVHAQAIRFQAIQYTDSQRGMFYILRAQPNAANVSPGGTYVWNPSAAHPVVIEVPHPRHDTYTEHQGIELFLASDAALLLLSGTHRHSDLQFSPCDDALGEGYRRSDAAHAVQHLFHVAHMTAEDELPEPLFIQLHGFGESAYQDLAEQCGLFPIGSDDPALLVNVSDAVHGDDAPPLDSLARMLTDGINAEGTIQACLYNEDTTSYGGTQNVQGRYTNGSPNACTEPAVQSSGRFIHLEQSYNTRRYQRSLLIPLIVDALDLYFSPE